MFVFLLASINEYDLSVLAMTLDEVAFTLVGTNTVWPEDTSLHASSLCTWCIALHSIAMSNWFYHNF